MLYRVFLVSLFLVFYPFLFENYTYRIKPWLYPFVFLFCCFCKVMFLASYCSPCFTHPYSSPYLCLGVLGVNQIKCPQLLLHCLSPLVVATKIIIYRYWVRSAFLMVGPDYTAPSCPVRATTFTNTLVLLELLNTFEEGGGPPPQKCANFCTGGRSCGAEPLIGHQGRSLPYWSPTLITTLLVTIMDHLLIGHQGRSPSYW